MAETYGRLVNLIATALENNVEGDTADYGYADLVTYDTVLRYPASPLTHKFKSFPAACVVVNGNSADYLDSGTNTLEINISVWTFISAKTGDYKKKWAHLCAITEATREFFHNDQYLANTVFLIRPVAVNMQVYDHDADKYYFVSEVVLQLFTEEATNI